MYAKGFEYSPQNFSTMWNIDNSKVNTTSENKLFKVALALYSIVLIAAATIILLLFENIITLNIYVIYLAVGILLGLSVILLIHIFSKKDKQIN